jgi:hypothetical protein
MGYKQYLSRGFPTLLPIFTKSLPIEESNCAHSGVGGRTRVAEEAAMFEVAQEQKQSSSSRMLVTIFVVVAAAAVGVVLYTMSKSGNKSAAPVTAAVAAPAVAGKADPVHDLKVLSARMEKDRTGTTAVWLVDIDNKSKAYTYSKIEYETTYVGPNNAALLVNKGTIPFNLAPGEEQNAQIRDVLYPAGTSWYKFRITGATSTAQ